MLYNPNADFFSFLRILRSTVQKFLIHKRFWWHGTFALDHFSIFLGRTIFLRRGRALLKIFRGVTTIREPAVLTKRWMQKRVKCRYFAYSHHLNIKLVFLGQHQIILLWQKVKKFEGEIEAWKLGQCKKICKISVISWFNQRTEVRREKEVKE